MCRTGDKIQQHSSRVQIKTGWKPTLTMSLFMVNHLALNCLDVAARGIFLKAFWLRKVPDLQSREAQ
jgi:hypothetical protein